MALLREVRASFKLLLDRSPKPTVLMYHSVGKNAAHFTVTPAMFAAQMDFLAKNGWRVLPLGELVARAKAGETGKLVAITFDDGYVDFIENAVPELNRRNFPATMFLIAGKMGASYSTSDGIAIPTMSWEEARAVQGDGIEFGSHTMTHPKLSKIPPDDVRKELAQSRDALKKELDCEGDLWLCYPHGRNSPDVRRVAREEGYAGAVTIEPGHPGKDTDLFGVPRMYVHSEMGLKEFEACLS